MVSSLPGTQGELGGPVSWLRVDVNADGRVVTAVTQQARPVAQQTRAVVMMVVAVIVVGGRGHPGHRGSCHHAHGGGTGHSHAAAAVLLGWLRVHHLLRRRCLPTRSLLHDDGHRWRRRGRGPVARVIGWLDAGWWRRVLWWLHCSRRWCRRVHRLRVVWGRRCWLRWRLHTDWRRISTAHVWSWRRAEVNRGL